MYNGSGPPMRPRSGSGEGAGAVSDPVRQALRWVQTRNMGQKAGLVAGAALMVLMIMYFVIEEDDHDILFVFSEACHLAGLGILVWKLQQKGSAAGLSLRTQNLTALFLTVRLYCSLIMEQDVHTLLDLLTLAATAWIIFTMLTKCRASWQADKDVLHELYVIVPCAVLALVSHPRTRHALPNRLLWAFCVFVEAASVAPQVAMMQRCKVVERFTGHYVAALAAARFFSCAHWILQMLNARNTQLWAALGSGLWPVMVLASEVVQTLVLADFVYYYLAALASGLDVVQLPAGIV